MQLYIVTDVDDEAVVFIFEFGGSFFVVPVVLLQCYEFSKEGDF